MSLDCWLRIGHRKCRRRAARSDRRPEFEALEDRLALSFVWNGIYYTEPPAGVVSAPSLPLLADFTSDGIADQISANYFASQVAVRPGLGDGTFGEPIYSVVQAPSGGASGVADLNSDGRLDVFVVSYYDSGTGTAWGNVLTGAGNGSFFTQSFSVDFVGYALTIPSSIGTGDLFGSGRTDVVVAGNGENHDVYYLVLANTAAVEPTLPGDYNDDNIVDGGDYVRWRNALAGMASLENETVTIGSVDEMDYAEWKTHYGQSRPMIATDNLVEAAPEPATAVLFGIGLAAVCGALFYRSPLRRTRQRASRRHAVRRPRCEPLEERSMLALLAPVDFPVVTSPGVMHAGDFNGDGIADLVTLDVTFEFGGGLSVLLGNPDGTGTLLERWPAWPAAAPLLGSLAVGDFNEDGKLDLAVGCSFDSDYGFGVEDVAILIGNGSGSFGSPVFIGTNLLAESLSAGDLNGDDKLDLIVRAYLNQQPTLRVLLGGGDGTFNHVATFGADAPVNAASPVLSDFDGDGHLDLADGGYVFLGNGDGTFQQAIISGAYVAYGTAVGDFNADGKLDLASAQSVGVAVQRGNGDGTFQPPQFFAAGSNPAAPIAADVNGDGTLDLVVANGSGPVTGLSVLLGTGGGSFGLPITTATGWSHTGPVVVADFNADGRPDVAVADYGSNYVSVLLNDGSWPAVGPRLPGDYNRDGRVDAGDYVRWRNTLNTSGLAPYAGADGSGNGSVGPEDYLVWKEHYGEDLPMTVSGARTATRHEVADAGQTASSVELSVEVADDRGGSVNAFVAPNVLAGLSRGSTVRRPAANFAAASHDVALLAWLTTRDEDRERFDFSKSVPAPSDDNEAVTDAALELLVAGL